MNVLRSEYKQYNTLEYYLDCAYMLLEIFPTHLDHQNKEVAEILEKNKKEF